MSITKPDEKWKSVTNEIDLWIKKTTVSSNPDQIKERVKKWSFDEVVIAKAYVSRKIAEKSAFDKVPLFMGYLATVIAFLFTAVDIFSQQYERLAGGITALFVFVGIVSWTILHISVSFCEDILVMINEYSQDKRKDS
ncbi:MAG: hypothetical protein K6A74_06160 [Lachnospiraceae bacterium]|nr:hypothetical protein [Lachnospiraceae bacterium]